MVKTTVKSDAMSYIIWGATEKAKWLYGRDNSPPA